MTGYDGDQPIYNTVFWPSLPTMAFTLGLPPHRPQTKGKLNGLFRISQNLLNGRTFTSLST